MNRTVVTARPGRRKARRGTPLHADRKCESRSAHRSLPSQCSGWEWGWEATFCALSVLDPRVHRSCREMWIAQFAHYRESEDKRDRRFSVSSARLTGDSARYVFFSFSSPLHEAIRAPGERDRARNTRKFISGGYVRGFILHL